MTNIGSLLGSNLTTDHLFPLSVNPETIRRLNNSNRLVELKTLYRGCDPCPCIQAHVDEILPHVSSATRYPIFLLIRVEIQGYFTLVINSNFGRF